MNLDFFNDLINKVKESDVVQNFMEELSNHLEKANEKGENQTNSHQNDKQESLYQVVDFSANGVFLQNTNNNKIFEETNMPQEIMDKIGNDYILSYENGTYNIEEEITEDFMNSMVGIQEYEKIKQDFINESNILEIDPNTHYKVQTRDKDYTMLSYGENNTLKVPNELIPYFTKEQTILNYKDGKFEKVVE